MTAMFLFFYELKKCAVKKMLGGIDARAAASSDWNPPTQISTIESSEYHLPGRRRRRNNTLRIRSAEQPPLPPLSLSWKHQHPRRRR